LNLGNQENLVSSDERMSDTIGWAYAYDQDFPLHATVEPFHEDDALHVERFEITSANDQRVPGLLFRPATDAQPGPTILVAHPATLDKASEYITGPAQQWARAGATCITIDQAGHGERASGPVSIEEFRRFPLRQARQSVQTAIDWMRVVDYLETRDDVDSRRLGFVGFSMGGRRGAAFVGLDQRVSAAVFCISGAATGTPTNDAEQQAKHIADPLTFAPMMNQATLVVAGTRDDVVPPDAARQFFDAMPEPKQIEWFECGHWDFMPQGLDPIWPFLESTL
jgi:dienelactone hydrolase